jgi:alanine-alpha-ketoisovalerate/valine-pyruvate aminotransferase
MTITKDEETGKYPAEAKHFRYFLDGQDMTVVCCGASEEEGWMDVGLTEAPYVPGKPLSWIVEDGKLKIERRFGKVEIQPMSAFAECPSE